MEFEGGFFDDDGNRINPFLVPKPGLCLVCKKDDLDDFGENILCAMNRWDQKDSESFECGVFVAIKGND
jgi:hypothetical protein